MRGGYTINQQPVHTRWSKNAKILRTPKREYRNSKLGKEKGSVELKIRKATGAPRGPERNGSCSGLGAGGPLQVAGAAAESPDADGDDEVAARDDDERHEEHGQQEEHHVRLLPDLPTARARAGTIPGVGVARPTQNPFFGGVTME